MLPDLPKAKQVIVERHLKRFHETHSKKLGPFSEARQSPIHEGHRLALVREDGTFEERKWKRVKASETIKIDEVENWTDEQIYAHFDRMAERMACEQKKLAFKEIDKAVRSVGNEVSINGPVSAEGILKTYERMTLDFNEDGTHVPLTLVCSPELQPQFQLAFSQLESDSTMRGRFKDLIEIKRNQWRERESTRKLVG